jgi:multidrug efflux pump subunit AcrA (membrane-fusion protein)
MKKSSKRKIILLITAAFAILLSLISFTACQVLGGPREGSSEKDIETFTVVKGNISQTVTSSGYVDTSNTKNYSLQMSGNTLYILSKGDTFAKGDKLVEVDNEKILIAIEQAETSIKAAESAISLARINYQAALDANHVAIQIAKANEEMGQASTNAAFTALEDANGLARASAESARQSIDDANKILAAAREGSASDTQIAQYEANVNAAESSYESSSATNRQATDAAEAGHEQSLISQSVTYWSNLGNLEVAQSQIAITALAIGQAEVELELANINIDSAKLDLDDNIIYAPFDGIVLESFYSKGEYASPSMTAISVISCDFVIKSDINETDIAKLDVGDD